MTATGLVAVGLSAVSAIGTQLRGPAEKLDAVAESRRNPVSKHQTQPEYVDNERAVAGRAEPV